MPTDAEIFAGRNEDLINDNIIQVARTNRNVAIRDNFNEDRTEGRIHISTIGARISRGLDFIANRDRRDRRELKEEFEAERRKNGVAGRNQHTHSMGKKRAAAEMEGGEEVADLGDAASSVQQAQQETPRPVKKAKMIHDYGNGTATPSTLPVKQRPRRHMKAAPKYEDDEVDDSDAMEDNAVPSPEGSDKANAKKATPERAPAHGQPRRDSVISAVATSSPLAKKGKLAKPALRPLKAVAGKKREREVEADSGESGGAGSGQSERPRKAARTESSDSASSSLSSDSSTPAKAQDKAQYAIAQGRKGLGAGGDDTPSSTSSCELGERSPTPSPPPAVQESEDEETVVGSPTASPSPTPSERSRRFAQSLEDAETNVALTDFSRMHDYYVVALAARLTVAEILQSANRASGELEHSRRDVTRRLGLALDRMAYRRGTSVAEQWNVLGRKRVRNGISPDGRNRVA